MTSYLYRDARRERLSAALAALPADDQALRPVLEAEQAALQTDEWTVTDRVYQTVGADWIWEASVELKALADADPALLALGQTASLTEAQSFDIGTLPRSPGGPPASFMPQVRAALGDDESILTELFHAAHRQWILADAAGRPYPFDDVGVLLPLRLETLFDAPGDELNPDPVRWQMLLRVTPDEVSIRRDDAFISPGERDALLAFWTDIRQPGVDLGEWWLDGDEAGIAWAQLCHRIRPERAAWLVSEIPFRDEGDGLQLDLPADMPDAPQPNRAAGLPPELHVFATTTVAIEGRFSHHIGRLPQDPDAQIQADALSLALPRSLEAGQEAWWVSWDKAQAVGLGGQWLLPPDMSPQTIAALYVVGLGDESPEAHFRAQIDAGELSVLRLGAPTNAVAGAPTANRGDDPADWRRVARERLRRRLLPAPGALPPVGSALQRRLLGPDGQLPFFAGADAFDETHDSYAMMMALWPALWGHWLRDLWQTGDDAYRAGVWMSENFFPEGPLPPLRIGDQPYGLLPVTSLHGWTVAPAVVPEVKAQRAVELNMARALAELRDRWAEVAQARNSVVGKTTSEFMELLGRDALSRDYLVRSFLPSWVVAPLFGWDPDRAMAFDLEVQASYEAAVERFGVVPDTLYLANSYPRPVQLPLVQPTRLITRENGDRLPLEEFLHWLYDWGPFNDPRNYDLALFYREHVLDALPDSLLLRLLINACQQIVFWQATPGGSAPEQRLWGEQQASALELAIMFDTPEWQGERPNPFQPDPLHPRHRFPTLNIPAERLRQLERALRATLDSAAHRIDPWVTGFAWQGLRRNSESWRGAHRLGAYGWVDGPLGGQPGPTRAGRLHTPSYNQTFAALVLRDKFLSSDRHGLVSEDGDNPWQMDITSSKARLAEELAEEVRLGFHIHEILGRRVEHIMGAHQTVKELRTSDAYAMVAARKDPNEVCNGEAALHGLLAGDPAFPLSPGQEQALRHLASALDTYGDLLMADGVMQLVNREMDRAAATMDAASGFTRPPSFDFLRTPPSGYQLESIVVSALPFVDVDSLDPAATPGRLADPSSSAFLEARLGTAWEWTALNADDGAGRGVVTLADLGLTPIDALALSEEFLGDLARRWLGLPLVFIGEARNRLWLAADAGGAPLGSVTLVELGIVPEDVPAWDTAALHQAVRQALGAPAEAIVTEGLPDDPRLWVARDEYGRQLGLISRAQLNLPPDEFDALDVDGLHRQVRLGLGLSQVRMTPPRQHQLGRQLLAALGNRPAVGRDLVENPSSPLAADAVARAALEAAIHADLLKRYTRLHTAAGLMIDELRGAADDDARAAALRRALTWGLVPATEPADAEALAAAVLGLAPAAGATERTVLVENAAKALEARRQAAPDPVAPPTTPELARGLANLAAPDGRLAILARWERDSLVNGLGLDIAETVPDLDEVWLTVVAAPRGPLARLEALQLELEPPLPAWSSAPHDPWQTEAVADNVARRKNGITALRMPRFAAAYGAAEVWDGATAAVGLIDAFSEAMPMSERTTMTAFGFNAPASRPPQAILLAVPPAAGLRLEPELLRQIVEETRALAHARTVRLEDLGRFQALAPTSWLRANGPLRMRLRPFPLTGIM